MTLKEAITLILTILKQVMEEKLSANNVEVVTVSPDKLFHMLSKEELEKVIYSLIELNCLWFMCEFHDTERFSNLSLLIGFRHRLIQGFILVSGVGKSYSSTKR